jgi:uncharacterized protein
MGQIIQSLFRPAPWLPGGHLQTLWAPLRRRMAPLARTRETLPLPDGDELDLDWLGAERTRIAVLLHGFTGSSNSSYMLGMQRALVRHGVGCVAVNFRGCSGRPNRRARSYHSGAIEDLDAVMDALRVRWPTARFYLVGYSLGGNVLLKWLGEREAIGVEAAVAVSVPLLLNVSVDRLNQGLSRHYQQRFLRDLRVQFDDKLMELLAVQPGEAAILQRYQVGWQTSASVREFDHGITAPLHGFLSADDYYARCSSRQNLPNIRVRTLIIQALDDPFMTRDIIPDAVELGDGVTFELSRAGGHVGFVGADAWMRPVYWLEHRVPAWLLSNDAGRVACYSGTSQPA